MTKLDELNGIDLRDGIVEVTIRQGNPDEFIEEVRRIVERNGYGVTKIFSKRNIYHIHYE